MITSGPVVESSQLLSASLTLADITNPEVQTSGTVSPFRPETLPDEKENIVPVGYIPNKEDSNKDKNAIWTEELENKADEDKDATWTPDGESDSDDEMTGSQEAKQQPKDASMKEKPPYTYRQMIVQALLSKENKQLSVEDICHYIQTTFFGTGTEIVSKYIKENVNQGLVHHFTSFKRIPSTLSGKVWTLHPVYEARLMKTAVKDNNGGWKIQFKQRKPRDSTKEKELGPQARAKLLPAKFKCRLCQCLHDSLTSMKQHIIENHGNQRALRPKMHKDNVVKQMMLGKFETTDIISDMDVRSLSCVVRQCPTCKKYMSERNIATHINSQKKIANYDCNICGQHFENRKEWREHRKQRHAQERVFRCKYCKQFFLTSESLSSHVSGAHPVERNHQCEVCGKSFRLLTSLKSHLPIHMAIKPYQCPECGKGFAKKTNMDSHRRVHTGEKPYKCDLCSQAYTHNVSLKRHKKKMHGIDMWAK